LQRLTDSFEKFGGSMSYGQNCKSEIQNGYCKVENTYNKKQKFNMAAGSHLEINELDSCLFCLGFQGGVAGVRQNI
jgi:hypothetical protein